MLNHNEVNNLNATERYQRHLRLLDALTTAGHNVSIWADDPFALRAYADAISFEEHPMLTVDGCDYCGKKHQAEPVHVSPTQGQIYAVVCTDVPVSEQVIDYYTSERVS